MEGAGIAHRRIELGHRAAFGLGDIKVADGEPFPQGGIEQGFDEEFDAADLRGQRADQEDFIAHGNLAIRTDKVSKGNRHLQMESARDGATA